MPTFSYDPTKIMDGGVDQMRFELGDTVTDMGGVSSPLCNEDTRRSCQSTAATGGEPDMCA